MSLNSLCSLLFLFSLLSSSTTAFNITSILSNYPDFSTFNNDLTQSQVAAAINARQSITVLVVDNGAMSGLSGQPVEAVQDILSLHVVLDYFDPQKLKQIRDGSAVLTTLLQTTGRAVGLQGFLNVTVSSSGGIAFGSAVPGSSPGATLVKSVTSEPYNISILQISSPIVPPNIGKTNSSSGSNSTYSPPSPSPASPSPGKSPVMPMPSTPTMSPGAGPPKSGKAPTPAAATTPPSNGSVATPPVAASPATSPPGAAGGSPTSGNAPASHAPGGSPPMPAGANGPSGSNGPAGANGPAAPAADAPGGSPPMPVGASGPVGANGPAAQAADAPGSSPPMPAGANGPAADDPVADAPGGHKSGAPRGHGVDRAGGVGLFATMTWYLALTMW